MQEQKNINLVNTFGKFQSKLKCKHNNLKQSSTCEHIQNIAFKQQKLIQQVSWIILSRFANIYLPSLKSSKKNGFLMLPSLFHLCKPRKNWILEITSLIGLLKLSQKFISPLLFLSFFLSFAPLITSPFIGGSDLLREFVRVSTNQN